MKLNTISKGIFTCLLAGTLALGLNSCSKPESKPEEPKQETIKQQETIKNKEPEKEYVINVKGYDDCQIFLSPSSKTGQTLKVSAYTFEPKNAAEEHTVAEKRLYEDGKLIGTEKGEDYSGLEAISENVIYKEPCMHSYYAEFVYKDGHVQKSETKSAEFTGEVLDLPPTGQSVWLSEDKLFLYAIDEGDNKGIVKIKVYEDETLWKEINFEPNDWVGEKVPLDFSKTGKHKYYAEFTDKGGNIVKTEAIVINYR